MTPMLRKACENNFLGGLSQIKLAPEIAKDAFLTKIRGPLGTSLAMVSKEKRLNSQAKYL